MPLETYRRGATWWVRGRIEINGRPVSSYYRCSTGASDEAGARDWIRVETDRVVRRALLGREDAGLTFAEAVMLYPAKPAEAKYLDRVLDDLGEIQCARITPRLVRDLGPKLYPDAATDTWRRQVVTPVSAVINNAHELGRCPPIRIKGYTTAERTAQDARRGKQSRVERQPADRDWHARFDAAAGPYLAALAAFMFETGARIGQAVALTWSALDLPQARVRMPASKGHPEQWVAISMGMVARLANLKPKRPHDRKRGRKLPPRVFGYATRGGPLKAWRTACDKAGIPYLPPHSAGRHGFYTTARLDLGLDPVQAARLGRWSGHALPEATYLHSDVDERAAREALGTRSVQVDAADPVKPMKRKGA